MITRRDLINRVRGNEERRGGAFMTSTVDNVCWNLKASNAISSSVSASQRCSCWNFERMKWWYKWCEKNTVECLENSVTSLTNVPFMLYIILRCFLLENQLFSSNQFRLEVSTTRKIAQWESLETYFFFFSILFMEKNGEKN